MHQNSWPRARPIALARLSLPLILVAVVFSVTTYLPLDTGTALAATIYFFLSIACAWFGGSGATVMAVLGSAAALYALGPWPAGSLAIDADREGDWLMASAASLLVASTVVRACRINGRRERAARIAAEQRRDQAERIGRMAGAFARVRTSDDAIVAALHESLHVLAADAAAFALLDDDGLRVVRTAGYDEPPPTGDLGLPPPFVQDTIDSRTAGVLRSTDAEPDSMSPPGWEPPGPVLLLPLVVSGRVVALLRIDTCAPRSPGSDDEALPGLIADSAARALERTWSTEADQRARLEAESLRARADVELASRQVIEQALRSSETRYRALATRTARLHSFTAALSEAVTTAAVAKVVSHYGTIVAGATRGEVWMCSDERTQLARVGGGPQSPALAVDEGRCESEAILTARPVFIHSWADSQARFWRSATAAADEGYASSAALPLVIDGIVIGVLRFDFSVPVNFDGEYEILLFSVAQHCTQALDRARLYESAQRGRRDAEAISRIKDEFLSIVSHELRTPLNAVLGWASMLQKALDPGLAQRAARSIQENAARQAQLIDDLLDVSRCAAGRTTLELEELHLGDLVAGVIESLMPVAAGGGVALSCTSTGVTDIRGDRRRLEQVCFNVMGNALKFTPAGGRVDVAVQPVDGQAEITVTDTGIGIEPAFLPHVFERFRQADSTSTRAYGGLGLGLAIAAQFVEAHEGAIDVSSAGAGHGTTFTVRIPLLAGGAYAARPVPTLAQPATADWPRLDQVRVLAVDDEPATLEVLACALSACGASVTTAASAQEAFDLLRATPFDVLLADIAMPGEDGCSLLRRVRQCGDARLAALPAAAVTAHAREDERQDVVGAGFNLHLVKPLHPRELARAVQQLSAAQGAHA